MAGVPERGMLLWQGLGDISLQRKGAYQLWEGLKSEFRLDAIKIGSYGSFLSKRVAAGRGVWVGDGLRKKGVEYPYRSSHAAIDPQVFNH